MTTPFCTGMIEVSILFVYNYFEDLGGHFRTLATNIDAFFAIDKICFCFFNNLFNFHSTEHENFVLS